MAAPSKFTPEYKKKIVRLVNELGKKPAEVVKDIGVTEPTRTSPGLEDAKLSVILPLGGAKNPGEPEKSLQQGIYERSC